MWDKVFKGLTRVGVLSKTPKLKRRQLPVSIASDVLNGNSFLHLTPAAAAAESAIHFEDVNRIVSNSGGRVSAAGAADGLSSDRLAGIICDARHIRSISELSAMFSEMKAHAGGIKKNGAICFLAPRDATSDIECSAVNGAMVGFTKSLAKEMALRGVRVNMLTPVDAGVTGALPFLLSERSAYVTGQVIRLSQSDGSSSSDTADAFSLQKKRVLLTGSARGIGEQTARLLAAEGAQMMLLDHPSMEKELTNLAQELNCSYLTSDVTDSSTDELVMKQLQNVFGDQAVPSQGLVDVIIHNAGITRDKTFKRMQQKQFEEVLQVNLSSVIRMDRMLLANDEDERKMIASPTARFVYLSSISGIAGAFGQSNYSCSKAGLIKYVRAISRHYKQNQGTRRFNAVAPGFIETEMTNAMPGLTRNIARRMNAFQQGGKPFDVAEAILFLSSDASHAVNGETLRVCGGHMVGK